MAKFCTNCGAAVSEGAGFCGSCGTATTSAPTAPATPVSPPAYAAPPADESLVTSAPAAPAPTPGRAAAPIDLSAVIRKATGGGIAAPLKVAGTMLVVSFVLSVAVGLLEMVRVPHMHWTFTAVTTSIGTIWAAIFGADLGIKASVHGGPFTFSGSGGISAIPLTLTTLTLGAGIIAFRRVTARGTSLVASALTAASAALATVLSLLIMTLIVGMNTHDIEKAAGVTDCTSSSTVSTPGGMYDSNGNYVGSSGGYDSNGNFVGSGGTSTDSSACINSTVAEAMASGSKVTIGPSSGQVFFFGFVLILVVLMGATLARRELYAGRYTVWVRNLLRGPVSGFGWLLVGLIPAGWIYFAFVYFLRPGSTGTETSQLHVRGWTNLLTAVFAGGANLGVVALGLGAWGKYGGSYSAAGHEDGRHFGLSYIAGNHSGGSDPGFWAAAGLAPLVLAFAVFMVVRAARREGLSAVRWSAATWIVSMLAAFPLLDRMSSLSAHGSAAMFSMHAGTGFNTLATFTVFGYSLLIGIAVLALAGALKDVSIPRLTRGVQTAPVAYSVGDMINGHRFTGTEWVSVDSPPTTDQPSN